MLDVKLSFNQLHLNKDYTGTVLTFIKKKSLYPPQTKIYIMLLSLVTFIISFTIRFNCEYEKVVNIMIFSFLCSCINFIFDNFLFQ